MAEPVQPPETVRGRGPRCECRCRTVDEHRRAKESVLRRAALRGEPAEPVEALPETAL